jgi:hypothetical protein
MTKKKTAPKAKAATAPEPEKKFNDVKNLPFRKALQLAGGYTKLASDLGVSRQMAHRWEAIPDRLALKVEELYGIPRQETAPHLYKGMVTAE